MPEEVNKDPLKRNALANYTPDDIRSQLTAYYVDDFINQWRAFIASGRVYDYFDLSNASEVIGELAQKPSPLVKVLDKVYDNVGIRDANGDAFRRIEDEFRALGRFLGRVDTDQGEVSGATGYSEELMGVADQVGTTADQLSGEARCARSFSALDRKISNASTSIRRSLPGAGVSASAVTLLLEPMVKAEAVARGATCDCLDRIWKNTIYDEFQGGIGQTYPFNSNSSTSASLSQVHDFFASKLDAFFEGEITPAQDEAGISPSPAFRRAMDLAEDMASKMKRGGTKLQFSLSADARNMSGSGLEYFTLKYGSDSWQYSMGPTIDHRFNWPPPGGDATSTLSAFATGGIYYRSIEGEGEWGILRLIDQARHDKGSSLLGWTVEPISGNGPSITIRLNLGGTDAAFLLNGHFTQFVRNLSVISGDPARQRN